MIITLHFTQILVKIAHQSLVVVKLTAHSLVVVLLGIIVRQVHENQLICVMYCTCIC